MTDDTRNVTVRIAILAPAVIATVILLVAWYRTSMDLRSFAIERDSFNKEVARQFDERSSEQQFFLNEMNKQLEERHIERLRFMAGITKELDAIKSVVGDVKPADVLLELRQFRKETNERLNAIEPRQ